MPFTIHYTDGRSERVDATEYVHHGTKGELITFNKVITDGYATASEAVLTVRAEEVARIEPAS